MNIETRCATNIYLHMKLECFNRMNYKVQKGLLSISVVAITATKRLLEEVCKTTMHTNLHTSLNWPL